MTEVHSEQLRTVQMTEMTVTRAWEAGSGRRPGSDSTGLQVVCYTGQFIIEAVISKSWAGIFFFIVT